jgi:hypothetical protein
MVDVPVCAFIIGVVHLHPVYIYEIKGDGGLVVLSMVSAPIQYT